MAWMSWLPIRFSETYRRWRTHIRRSSTVASRSYVMNGWSALLLSPSLAGTPFGDLLRSPRRPARGIRWRAGSFPSAGTPRWSVARSGGPKRCASEHGGLVRRPRNCLPYTGLHLGANGVHTCKKSQTTKPDLQPCPIFLGSSFPGRRARVAVNRPPAGNRPGEARLSLSLGPQHEPGTGPLPSFHQI